MTKQKLLDLIDEAKIAELFKELDELGINDSRLNDLKNAFIAGETGHQFYDRLKVLVRRLKLPNSEIVTVFDKITLPTSENLNLLPTQLADIFKFFVTPSSQILTEEEKKQYYYQKIEIEEILREQSKLSEQDVAYILFERLITPQIEITESEREKIAFMPQNEAFSLSQKCLVVSALTLSLMQEFNEDRMHLLLNFIDYGQDLVWQCALTGVVLGLLNREEYAKGFENLHHRLRKLQANPYVQEGLFYLNIAFIKEQYKELPERNDFINFNRTDYEFFKKPQNWFLLFDENNKMVVKAFQQIGQQFNINVNILKKIIVCLSAPESDKYFISLIMSDLNFIDSNKDKIEELKELIKEVKRLSTDIEKEINKQQEENKYQIYHYFLGDLFRFNSFYSMEKLHRLFDEQIILSKTNLLKLLVEKEREKEILVRSYFEEGEFLYALENYAKAIESYQKAIEIKPDNDEVWHNLGNAYLNLQDYAKAIESYQKAIEIKPEQDNTWIFLGFAYDNLENYERAIESYQKAIEINSNNDKLWYNLGNAYYDLENYAKAIESYQKAIEIEPEDDRYWNNLGNAYYNLEDYEKVIECYEKMLEINPNDGKAWSNLISIYRYTLEDYEKVIECYEKMLEINPNDGKAWSNLISIYRYTLKDYAKAIECYEKILEINPNDGKAWSNLGGIYHYDLKDYAKAIESYQKAIEIDLSNDDYWHDLAETYIKLGKYEAAKKIYEKTPLKEDIDIDIDKIKDWQEIIVDFSLIVHLTKLKEYQIAFDFANILAEKYPKNSGTWFLFGLLHYITKEYQKANDYMHKALNISPDNFLVTYVLSIIASLQKDKAQSLNYLQKAIALSSKYKEDVKTNTNFEWLWEDADFKALVNS